MNSTLSPTLNPNTDRESALQEFFAALRTVARESDAAIEAAKPALARLAAAIAGRDNGQALYVRSVLLSLYTGGTATADISDLMTLDWAIRKDLCAVLLAFGCGEFSHEYLKSAFELAGDTRAQWFLGAAHDPRERLNEALAFAKRGPVSAPRTLSEKGVALFLLSLFAGIPADLQIALRGLDGIRSELVVGILADYVAQRFDFTDEDLVREHFELPS